MVAVVIGTELPDVVELWDWTLVPGDRHRSEAHAPGTRELLQVQQGSIVVTIGEQFVRLDTGDALTSPGNVSHSCANHDSRPARFSLVVVESGVGAASRQEVHDV